MQQRIIEGISRELFNTLLFCNKQSLIYKCYKYSFITPIEIYTRPSIMKDMRITKKEVTIMLKKKPEKLQMFKVDYSVLKKKKIVNGFIIIKSVEDTDKIVKLAKLDISTKERVFIQDVKVLKFKPFSS
jgi:hypothetical protein